MKMVTYKAFETNAICGERISLPYGTEVEMDERMVRYNGKEICMVMSQFGKEHFARDDDGFGLERGKLIQEIAFTDKYQEETPDGTFVLTFSPEQGQILREKYSDYLRDNESAIFFRDKFYLADIEVLQQIADDLHISTAQ